MAAILERTYISDLVANKRLLISAPPSATVAQVLHLLSANEITAIPIASSSADPSAVDAPLLQGSSHFIGIVSMADIVLHIGDNLDDCERALETHVSAIIGQTIESRALWTVSHHVKLIDAMEFLSKGVHRFLVPAYEDSSSRTETTQYRLLTQTDVVKFLVQNIDELGPCVRRTVIDLGLIHPSMAALAVPSDMLLRTALRIMHQRPAFSSFAVVETEAETENQPKEGRNANVEESGSLLVSGGRLVGSLTANDFRGMGIDEIKALKNDTRVAEIVRRSGAVVTVRPTSPLGTVMAVAVENKVHRVWVTDEDGWLLGVVSFSDIISVVRRDPSSFIQA
eukprot:TRINITY_DN8600_c0_g1_i1.p1 TRINITY_DN8600_c0_g1~~TRINITY_DN8600_c0_g1_i1.p1  ORF type:complete len:365 (-),score=24.76 TRINITY_DN8600_c0_g1_i1:174-1190(-)